MQTATETRAAKEKATDTESLQPQFSRKPVRRNKLVSSSCARMQEASFSGVPNQVMQRILERQQNSKFRAA